MKISKNVRALVLGLLMVMVVVSTGTVFYTSETTQQPANAPSVVQTVEAPDFARPTLAGDTLRLSDHQGKIVVLNFWATWCPPCRKEIPDFIELQKELSEDVIFIGVALDEEGFEVIRPFAMEYGINYPLIVDHGMLARQYGGITSVPTTFIIDREGNIRYRTPGMVPKKIMRTALLDMIKKEE